MLLEEAEERWKSEKEKREEKNQQESDIKNEAEKFFLDEWYLISQRNKMVGSPIPRNGILNFFLRLLNLTEERFCPICRKKMISRVYIGDYIWRSQICFRGNDTDLSDELWKELFPYEGMRAVKPEIFKCEACGFEYAKERIIWNASLGGVD